MITWVCWWIELMDGIALTDNLDDMLHSRFILYYYWYNFQIKWVGINRMLVDTRTKTKLWHKQSQKQLLLPYKSKPGGNMTYTQICQKHIKAISIRAIISASIILQSTIGFFPLKDDCTYLCEYYLLCRTFLFVSTNTKQR